MLQTTKEAKTLAKGLRREVLNYTAEELAQLTLTQWLSLMAKAAGHPSWNVMKTKLQDDAAAQGAPAKDKVSTHEAPGNSYLRNQDGAFDFDVEDGEDCHVLDGVSLKPIRGSWDVIPGVAELYAGRREGGRLIESYAGETDVDWDKQRPKKSPRGDDYYVLESGALTERSLLVLLPERYNEKDQETWPVREALVAAYRDWLLRNKDPQEHVSMWISSAWKVLGLKLTDKEEALVVEAFEKDASRR